MYSSPKNKMIYLTSSDNVTFEVPEAVALESPTIKQMVKDDSANPTILVVNVKSCILSKVIDYCRRHVKAPESEDLKSFDADFVKVDHPILLDLMLASDYLNIKSLRTLTCKTVAERMNGKTIEEMRKVLCVENDYTPEEEEEVRRGIAWAFV